MKWNIVHFYNIKKFYICFLLKDALLFGLKLKPEDGGDKFLRKISLQRNT
jgi:hypothetical protein